MAKVSQNTKVTGSTEMKKPHLNVAVIGHVDHGKTTLSAAITSVLAKAGLAKKRNYDEIDKAPEERKRGITINSSHVEINTNRRHYSLIDCPGHADYIKNMIGSTSQAEGAIVVVSSVDGAQPQTIEHLKLAKNLGLARVIVFINDKTEEGMDEDSKELSEADIRSILEDVGFDNEAEGKQSPVIFASAYKALQGDAEQEKGIMRLLDTVDEYFPDPDYDESKPFLFYIEKLSQIVGVGPVATGKVTQGVVRPGDTIELVGFVETKKCVVRDIEMHNKKLDKALPGYDIGISTRADIKDPKKEIRRGRVLAKEGFIVPSSKFKATAYISSESENGRKTSFGSGYRPQFFISTIDFTGKITLNDDADGKKRVNPGEYTEFTVEANVPIAIFAGNNFVIREGGKTVGNGVITEVIHEDK